MNLFNISNDMMVVIWYIISLIIAIVGAILLYFTIFSKTNEGKYTGFVKWCYDFFTFKKLLLEVLLKITYIAVALFITISSLALIPVNFLGFIIQLTLGNVIARIVFEFLLLLLTICKNTTEINDKMPKKVTKKEEK